MIVNRGTAVHRFLQDYGCCKNQSCYQGLSLRGQGQGQDFVILGQGQDLHEVSSRILEAKARPRGQKDWQERSLVKPRPSAVPVIQSVSGVVDVVVRYRLRRCSKPRTSRGAEQRDRRRSSPCGPSPVGLRTTTIPLRSYRSSSRQHHRLTPFLYAIPGRAVHTGRPVVRSISPTPTWSSPLPNRSAVAALALLPSLLHLVILFSLCSFSFWLYLVF